MSMAPTQIAEVLRSPLELTVLNLKKLGNASNTVANGLAALRILVMCLSSMPMHMM